MRQHDTTGKRPALAFGWDRMRESIKPENGTMVVGNLGRGQSSLKDFPLTTFQFSL